MLNTPTIYLNWWLIVISLPNLIVIGLMVLVFILAVTLPLPSRRSYGRPEGETE